MPQSDTINNMGKKFTTKTFKYFDLAAKNKNNKTWFEKNKNMYLSEVREPFEVLIAELQKKISQDLPRISVDPRSITRPIRPSNRAQEGGLIKSSSHVTIWEKKTSLFEWNPGIHIQFGAVKEDNFYGLGLYMVSSRQMSLLRNALLEDFDEIDSILTDKKLQRAWGQPLGEKFKRFPKGYNPDDSRTKYHWHKQFYLGKTITRKDVLNPNFSKTLVKEIEIAMPFFKWVRQAVGVYSK